MSLGCPVRSSTHVHLPLAAVCHSGRASSQRLLHGRQRPARASHAGLGSRPLPHARPLPKSLLGTAGQLPTCPLFRILPHLLKDVMAARVNEELAALP